MQSGVMTTDAGLRGPLAIYQSRVYQQAAAAMRDAGHGQRSISDELDRTILFLGKLPESIDVLTV